MKIQRLIEQQLQDTFSPSYMTVENESHMHSVPEHSETHFKLVMVSDIFQTQRAVARHQSVYKALADYMNNPVHALALHLYSSSEWTEQQIVSDSPLCLGGR